MKRSLALVVALVVTLLAASATAGPLPPPIEVTEEVTLKADTGEELRVPPGRYLPEPTWHALDLEMRRLQDAETRLAAENQSLRSSLDEGPGWGTWVTIGLALAAGIGVGAIAY